MDVKAVCARLGVRDARVRERAEDLVLESRVAGGSGALGAAEMGRSAACVELALRHHNLPAERTKLQKLSCLPPNAYLNALRAISSALRVPDAVAVDTDALAVRLGCMRSRGTARRVLGEYKERFVRKLPAARRRGCDFSRATFGVVALFLAAKKDKLKVDWREACEATGVDEDDFQKVHNSMRDLCYDLVGGGERAGGATTKEQARGVKRHRDLMDATDFEAAAAGDGNGKGAAAAATAAGGGKRRAAAVGATRAEQPRRQHTRPGKDAGGPPPTRATASGGTREPAASRGADEEKRGAAAAVARARAHTQGGAGPSGVGKAVVGGNGGDAERSASVAAARALLASAPPPKKKKVKQAKLSFFKAAATAQR